MKCKAIWDCPKKCDGKCCFECDDIKKCYKKDWQCKLKNSSNYKNCDKYICQTVEIGIVKDINKEKHNCYELVFLDALYKNLDDIRTTIQLLYYDVVGQPITLAYVDTEETVNEAKANKDKHIDTILKLIRENITIEDSIVI